MPSSPPDDSLSPSLKQWRLAPPSNPNFRRAVWAKIDAARRPSNWAMFARAHPAVVAGVLAVGIALGAWKGHAEAQQRIEADRNALAANYVHALDARWMRTP